jgi:hypothetical protein
MLSKCANPECSASFRYFHEGQLFRVETEAPVETGPGFGTEKDAPLRQIEFFWLCDNCAPAMTLTFERGVGIRALAKAPVRAEAILSRAAAL